MAVPTQDMCLTFLWVGRGKAVMVAWMWAFREHTLWVWAHLLPRSEVLSKESKDTASEMRTTTNRCSDLNRKRKGLCWQYPAISFEYHWKPILLTQGITHAEPYWSNAKVRPSGMSFANVPSQTGRRDGEVPSQAASFWEFVWYTKGAGRSPSVEYWFWEKPSSCCRNDDFPPGITTTTGHCSSLCSRQQPLHSFCFWNCYKIAKKNKKTKNKPKQKKQTNNKKKTTTNQTKKTPTPLGLRKHGW